ncbi:unnamed protein product [Trichobilharzia regenti]|nr:unnamed protein product [Trichobilharzia regenti]
MYSIIHGFITVEPEEERLFYDLSTLKARGHSNFSTPLEFAYEMFRNLAGSARGDRGKELRNKILVMMTDNAFVFDEYVMSQLKQQKSNVSYSFLPILSYPYLCPINYTNLSLSEHFPCTCLISF